MKDKALKYYKTQPSMNNLADESNLNSSALVNEANQSSSKLGDGIGSANVSQVEQYH
jgi:hypothetical protein